MTRAFFGCIVLVLGCMLGLAAPARADTPLALYQSFRGTLNFVGAEETLRTKDNNYPCQLVSSSTALYTTITGIPSGATIKSAQLYWAGSGTTADYTVTFDGVSTTAPTNRQFQSGVSANNTTYTYFSGAADVTTQVAKKGNASYSISGLTVNTGNPWCGAQGVLGGFALVVVYSHPNEPFRMVNLYEGFQSFRSNSLTINLSGFNVPNPLDAAATARVGHITWEGDTTLSQGGEDLLFNGVPLIDGMNPQGNQFNSASNVTGDSSSFGIDFDIYSVKSPTIQAGQSSATSVYRSGPDMVLLSSEIVAMPYASIADLQLSMARNGDLTVGYATDYTLTVSNGGVDAETGPVKVVDTLPAGLKLVGTSGTGWTCTNAAGANGTTIVTCTQPGPVAVNGKMTPLTISVTPASTGSYTNSAVVSGASSDSNAANNTASNSSSAAENTTATVVFTREACTDGQPIVTAPSDVGCHRFIGPVKAADTATKIYITSVTNGKADSLFGYDTTLKVDLNAACLPFSSVTITYAGTTLDCVGGWKTVSVTIRAGKPSADLPNSSAFFYADVGRVALSLRYSGTVMGTVNFISQPVDIRFKSIFRADGFPDWKGTAGEADGAYAKDDRYGFTAAGAPFTMRLGALMADNNFAPSFGKEPTALKNVLPVDQIDLDLRLDLFAVNMKASPKAPLPGTGNVIETTVQDAFVVDQAWTLNTNTAVAGAGSIDARVRWYEAGNFAATPYLIDYLGTGPIGGAAADKVAANPSARLVASTRVIGRFYPDHFETDAIPALACPAAANCPLETNDPTTTPAYPVNGAVYAMQPFAVGVKAFGQARGGKAVPLSLFQNASGPVGANRAIGLSAVARPDGAATPAGGPFTVSTAKPLPVDPAVTDFPDLVASATYKLGATYSPATAATRGATSTWVAPALIYVRAAMTERILSGSTAAPTTTNVTVDSRVPSGAAAGTRYEDGLYVMAGRVLVPNVFGTDLLRLPVPLVAQYWNGSFWATSDGDIDSTVASAIVPIAGSCRKYFTTDPKTGACKATPLVADPTLPLPLRIKAGKASLVLTAPARGTVGSVDFKVDNGAANAWLPSTVGRATFGLFRSPLIYLREVY